MRQVKLKRGDLDNIYFASDFHRNHRKEFVWQKRGFSSIGEHDAWLDRECAKLTEKDLLIFLGDTALNSSYEETERFILGIKAKKFWLWGNHASWDFPIYLKYSGLTKESGYEVYPTSVLNEYVGIPGYDKQARLVFFGYDLRLRINGAGFYCSHTAPLVWESEYEHALYGHSHGGLLGSQPEDLNHGKRLDCGVDNAIKYNGTAFFKYEEIVDIMSKKNGIALDHHK